jgi:membrane glycosyltransferase
MKRDRRWCQGNIQHLRLMFARGFKGGHRALFLNGVFSYVSAAVWFIFLVLSTYEAVADVFFPVNYFPRERMLFPEWPVWKPAQAIVLTGVTAVVLFVPKVLGIVAAVVTGSARGFGGFLRLLLSALFEVVFSTLMAPIRMVFHTRFVVLNLLGRTVEWKSAPREDEETGWGEALRRHALDSTLASAWAIALYLLEPGYFWWITPILGALALSVPLSVLTSRAKLGDRVRKLGLFVIPEERSPPQELREFAAHHAELRAVAGPSDPDEVFVAAVRDPGPWGLHLAMMRHHPRRLRKEITDARYATALRAVTEGPSGLGPRERRVILADPAIMTLVHEGVWSLPDGESAARWGLA